MSVLSRPQRNLISLAVYVVLLAAVGYEVFRWTFCYWYVETGNSLLLTCNGPPLPV